MALLDLFRVIKTSPEFKFSVVFVELLGSINYTLAFALIGFSFIFKRSNYTRTKSIGVTDGKILQMKGMPSVSDGGA